MRWRTARAVSALTCPLGGAAYPCAASVTTPGHDILKCLRENILRPQRPIKPGRFFYLKARDCARCQLKGDCLSNGHVNKAVVVGHDYPARWSEQDRRLSRRHRWRSEGFHGEAKTWHGLGCAMRHGLDNMKIQASLAAAALNLKRLGAALGAVLWAIRTAEDAGQDPLCIHHGHAHRPRPPRAPRPERGFLHSPDGRFLRNALDSRPRTADDDCRQALRWRSDRPRPQGGPAGPVGVAPALGALSAQLTDWVERRSATPPVFEALACAARVRHGEVGCPRPLGRDRRSWHWPLTRQVDGRAVQADAEIPRV